jgi:hypothetical protein
MKKVREKIKEQNARLFVKKGRPLRKPQNNHSLADMQAEVAAALASGKVSITKCPTRFTAPTLNAASELPRPVREKKVVKVSHSVVHVRNSRGKTSLTEDFINRCADLYYNMKLMGREIAERFGVRESVVYTALKAWRENHGAA